MSIPPSRSAESTVDSSQCHARAPVCEVEEVIVETLVSSRIRLRPLSAPPEEAKCRERSLGGLRARDHPTLDTHRVRGEPQPRGGDAGRPIGQVLSTTNPFGAVGLVHEVAERIALDRVEHARVRIPTCHGDPAAFPATVPLDQLH